MIATLIGMPSIAQVTSSWLVIWKQPSPSIAQTVVSGRPTLAPIAAGTAYPMVPAPPEFSQVYGVLVRDELGGPHLVLADTGNVDRLRTHNLAEPLDHVLRGQRPVRRSVRTRAGTCRASSSTCCHQPVDVRFGHVVAGRSRARRSTSFAVAHDRHVRDAVLADLSRVDVGVDDRGLRRERVDSLPVTRSSNRAPSVISRSDFCRAVTAATVPCMPGMPRCWWCAVREGAAGHQRRHDRDAGQLGELVQLGGGVRLQDAAADVAAPACGSD